MKIRDRIKELRRVPARELRVHPRNWRTHPEAQQEALRGLLQELGYCDALITRELPDGGLELIDGHLRRERFVFQPADHLEPIAPGADPEGFHRLL